MFDLEGVLYLNPTFYIEGEYSIYYFFMWILILFVNSLNINYQLFQTNKVLVLIIQLICTLYVNYKLYFLSVFLKGKRIPCASIILRILRNLILQTNKLHGLRSYLSQNLLYLTQNIWLGKIFAIFTIFFPFFLFPKILSAKYIRKLFILAKIFV